MTDAASPSSEPGQASSNQTAAKPPVSPAAKAEQVPLSEPPVVNPLIYKLVIDALYLPVLLSGMHIEVHGREHVPPPGTPLVVAANHVTGLDPFLVARALPPGRFLQFMAKKELFMPVLGWFIRTGGSFPVDREANDVGAIRTALRILKENGTVGIFPQGHRGGEELHGGVALIAAKGRAPILPVGISRQGRRWIVRFGPLVAARGGIKGTTAELERTLGELARPVGQKAKRN